MSDVQPQPPISDGSIAPQYPQSPVQNAAAPAEWSWARPAQQFTTAETEPLEYHRLLRGTRNYRWWRPLLLLLLAGVYFGVGSVLIGLVLAPIMLAIDPTYATDMLSGDAELLDTQRPISLVFSLLSIIVMLPAVMLAMLTLGMRPIGRIWSVAGRIRWGLLMQSLLAAVAGVVVMNVVGVAVQIATNPGILDEPTSGESPSFDMSAAIISLAIVIVLVPIQATAEEVVFRGLFMQVLGSWLKSPWFAIIIPSVAFAFGHIYDVWGLLAVGLMGLVAAWISWKTGGLEAAIAIHVINNLFAFGMMSFGVGGSTAQTEASGGPGSVVGEIAGLAVFAWLALLIWRKGGHGRTRIDLIEVPVQAGLGYPGVPVAPVTWADPGAQQYAAPQPGAPQYGAPQYAPAPGAPQYGAPQYAPAPGAPQYGAPPHDPAAAAPQTSAPQYAPRPEAPYAPAYIPPAAEYAPAPAAPAAPTAPTAPEGSATEAETPQPQAPGGRGAQPAPPAPPAVPAAAAQFAPPLPTSDEPQAVPAEPVEPQAPTAPPAAPAPAPDAQEDSRG